MPPFCIGYAAESIGDYGSQAGRLDVPEDLARALAEAVIGDGIDLAVSLDMQVDHGAVQPMEIVYGDITAKPFVPIFINSVAPPFTPIAAGPAARRGHRPPPRHPGPEGPAHLLRRPVPRPARAAAGHRHPRAAAHADGRRRPAHPGGPRRPPAAGHRRRPGVRRRHRRRSRTSRPNGTANCCEILASGDLTPLDAWAPDEMTRIAGQLRPRGPHLDRRLRRARRRRPLHRPVQLLPAHPGTHRRLRAHHRHPRLTSGAAGDHDGGHTRTDQPTCSRQAGGSHLPRRTPCPSQPTPRRRPRR